MELPLGGPALRHYTRGRPRPHRQIQNHRPCKPQDTVLYVENEVPEFMGRVDEGVEEFFTKRVLPVEALKDQDEEPPITVEEVALASAVPCQPPSRTLRRRLGEFFAIKKRRGVRSETSHEGRLKKTSIADLIRPLKEAAKDEKDKDKVKENGSEKGKEIKDKSAVMGESAVQDTSTADLTSLRVEVVPPRRALRDGKSQSLILLSGCATACSGSTKSAGKKNSTDGQHSFEQKLHLMLQRIGVSKPPPGEARNQEREMKKAESEGTIIDNRPKPLLTFMKPRTMSTSSDTRRPVQASVSVHESSGKPTLPPKPFLKLSPPPTPSIRYTPEKELAQLQEGEPVVTNLTCASSSASTITTVEVITSTPYSHISAPATTEPTFIISGLDPSKSTKSLSTIQTPPTSDTYTYTASDTTCTTLLNDTTPFVAAIHLTPVLSIFNSPIPSTKTVTDLGQTDSTEYVGPSPSSCTINSEIVVLDGACSETLSTTVLPTDAISSCILPTATLFEGASAPLTGTYVASSLTNCITSNSNSFPVPIPTGSTNPKSPIHVTTFTNSSNSASNSTKSDIVIVFPDDLTLSTSQASPILGTLLTLDSTSVITANSTSPTVVDSVNSIDTSSSINTPSPLMTDKTTPITIPFSLPIITPVTSHSSVTLNPNITALTTSRNLTNTTSIIHDLTNPESTSQTATYSTILTTRQTLQSSLEEKPSSCPAQWSLDEQRDKGKEQCENKSQDEKPYDERRNLEQTNQAEKESNKIFVGVNNVVGANDDNGIIMNS